MRQDAFLLGEPTDKFDGTRCRIRNGVLENAAIPPNELNAVLVAAVGADRNAHGLGVGLIALQLDTRRSVEVAVLDCMKYFVGAQVRSAHHNVGVEVGGSSAVQTHRSHQNSRDA